MFASTRLRSTIAGACHALGAVWAIAGTLRLVFGTAVTFPILPPIDLARVHALPAFAVAIGLFFVGAVIGRPAGERSTRELTEPDARALSEPRPESVPHRNRASEQAKPANRL